MIVIMIQAARASARVACRSVVADATAGPALLLRGGAAPSLMRPRTPLVVVFSGAAQPRRGLASAVAATALDGDGRVDVEGAREVRAEAPKKQQPAETETKAPRRRRQLRERPAPITLVSLCVAIAVTAAAAAVLYMVDAYSSLCRLPPPAPLSGEREMVCIIVSVQHRRTDCELNLS